MERNSKGGYERRGSNVLHFSDARLRRHLWVMFFLAGLVLGFGIVSAVEDRTRNYAKGERGRKLEPLSSKGKGSTKVVPAPTAASGKGKGSTKVVPAPTVASGKGKGSTKVVPAPTVASGKGKGSTKVVPAPTAASGKGKGSTKVVPAPTVASGKGKGSTKVVPAPTVASGKGKGSTKVVPAPTVASGKGKGSTKTSFCGIGDCPEGSLCVDGVCVLCEQINSCETNSDCCGDRYCVDAICIDCDGATCNAFLPCCAGYSCVDIPEFPSTCNKG